MAEFLSAGVYTEELKSGESAILGVSTSNFATVGWLPRGKENVAVLVTSLSDYFRKFGGYWKNSDVPLAVTAFFKNDGARAYIVRVVPDDAVAAEVTVATNLWKIKAISKGAWGNTARAIVRGNANYYDHLTATYSKFDVEIQEESSDGANDFQTVETFEALDFSDSDAADYVTAVINDEIAGSEEITIEELNGGIPAAFNPAPVSNETVGTGTGSQQLFNHSSAQSPIATFTLEINVNGVLVAKDNGRGKLSIESGVSGFTGVSGTVNYDTGDIGMFFTPAVAVGETIAIDYIKAGVKSISYDLVGGADGTSVSRAQITDPALEANSKGLYALNAIDELMNIGLPDMTGSIDAKKDLIAYCENRGDCFAILDTPKGMDALDAKNYKQVTLSSLSDYAAIYWPQVKVADPLKDGKLKVMSNVGHVAGVFARTDITRNVAKAPAGVVEGRLNFVSALEFDTKKGDRDVVYPANVNPLISSPQTGIAVWGARCLAISGDFTIIPHRRLFMFLRKSVFNATQDLVFEPIDANLFATTKLRLESFMANLTQEGYFASRVPEEAYRVICDESNNTDASIIARQLITDVLVAVASPAEFVRFRFQRSLKTLG